MRPIDYGELLARMAEEDTLDRRCVTGPPDAFPSTGQWKLSHIESVGQPWGTETAIDAPDTLAAGSTIDAPWVRYGMPRTCRRDGWVRPMRWPYVEQS